MSEFKNKTVIVAGGAGFIGHHLVAALLDQQAVVHVVDNMSTGDAARLRTAGGRHANQLHVRTHDVAIAALLPEADIIFNLASPASPRHYQADPIATWKSNVLGTMNLLEHAQRCEATLVQASTSEVYGDPLSHPQKETDWGNVNPIGPRACYDESKRAAESLLMDAVRVAGADVRIARIFNTYGPGMSIADGRAIPNFIAQAEQGEPLTLHGDGSQTRSFCYVGDTVDAFLRLATVPAARGEVINVGNPAERTIRDLAERINTLWENPAGLIETARPVDDPSRRRPDISKAKAVLDWEPTVGLTEGLRRMRDAGQEESKRARLSATLG